LVWKRLFPAQPVIRISPSASAALLLCQRIILRNRRILVFIAADIPLVIIVYFFIVTPYSGRIAVNV
jgi:hypothetical protein